MGNSRASYPPRYQSQDSRHVIVRVSSTMCSLVANSFKTQQPLSSSTFCSTSSFRISSLGMVSLRLRPSTPYDSRVPAISNCVVPGSMSPLTVCWGFVLDIMSLKGTTKCGAVAQFPSEPCFFIFLSLLLYVPSSFCKFSQPMLNKWIRSSMLPSNRFANLDHAGSMSESCGSES